MNLIIGGTGFLGSHLAAYFVQQKRDFVILKRPSSTLQELEIVFRFYFGKKASNLINQIKFRTGDITDQFSIEDALTDITDVYNCSGFVSFNNSDKQKLFDINQIAQGKLINVLMSSNIRKYCHVSSIGALGRTEENENLITEETYLQSDKNNTTYSISKYKGELEAWRGIHEGLNGVIVNPGIILGVGNWENGTCRLFKITADGLLFYTNGINGYVDAFDVAKAMVLLTDSAKTGERYILVSENISYRELFEMIAFYMGKKPPKYEANYILRQSVVLADKLKNILLGSERMYTNQFAHLAAAISQYSSIKIQQEAGFSFTPIRETIQKTSQFYHSENLK